MKQAVFMIPTSDIEADLVANMREAEKRELWLTAQLEPAAAVRRSLEVADVSVAGMIDGRCAMIFGARQESWLSGSCRLWALGTDLVRQNPRVVVRASMAGLRLLFDVLGPHTTQGENQVWVENAVSVRWLKWMGAEFSAPVTMGPFGAMFYPFAIQRR